MTCFYAAPGLPWHIWVLWCQEQVSQVGITPHSLLWDVITYPCLRYLLRHLSPHITGSWGNALHCTHHVYHNNNISLLFPFRQLFRYKIYFDNILYDLWTNIIPNLFYLIDWNDYMPLYLRVMKTSIWVSDNYCIVDVLINSYIN